MPYPENLPERQKIITLPKPIEIQGGFISELSLREPQAGEMWVAEGALERAAGPEGHTTYVRDLVAQVTGVKRADFLDDVPMWAHAEAYEYLAKFILAGLDVVENPDPNWDIDLPDPITEGNIEYSTISLSAPALGAVKKAQGQLRKSVGQQSYRAYQMHLVANVSGAPLSVVKRMPISLLNAAEAYLAGFTVAGRQTGAT